MGLCGTGPIGLCCPLPGPWAAGKGECHGPPWAEGSWGQRWCPWCAAEQGTGVLAAGGNQGWCWASWDEESFTRWREKWPVVSLVLRHLPVQSQAALELMWPFLPDMAHPELALLQTGVGCPSATSCPFTLVAGWAAGQGPWSFLCEHSRLPVPEKPRPRQSRLGPPPLQCPDDSPGSLAGRERNKGAWEANPAAGCWTCEGHGENGLTLASRGHEIMAQELYSFSCVCLSGATWPWLRLSSTVSKFKRLFSGHSGRTAALSIYTRLLPHSLPPSTWVLIYKTWASALSLGLLVGWACPALGSGPRLAAPARSLQLCPFSRSCSSREVRTKWEPAVSLPLKASQNPDSLLSWMLSTAPLRP